MWRTSLCEVLHSGYSKAGSQLAAYLCFFSNWGGRLWGDLLFLGCVSPGDRLCQLSTLAMNFFRVSPPRGGLFSSVTHTGRTIFKCQQHRRDYFQVLAPQEGLFSSVSHTGRTIFKCQPHKVDYFQVSAPRGVLYLSVSPRGVCNIIGIYLCFLLHCHFFLDFQVVLEYYLKAMLSNGCFLLRFI